MGEKFSHLSYAKRLKIEALLQAKCSKEEIAKIVGVHISTINREIQRGRYMHRNSDWTEEDRYSPEIAEEQYRTKMKAKGRAPKIHKEEPLMQLIEDKIIHHKCSPYAALVQIKNEGYTGEMICVNTCYNYIKKNRFPALRMGNLCYRKAQKGRKQKVQKRANAGISIEQRPKKIDDREEFGHWEMDTVVGPQGKSKKCLLVLTERKARKEILEILNGRTTKEVVRALNKIERQMGSKTFRKMFKTITVDNGSEFADVQGLESSYRNKKKRTQLYYCHPYTSSERGSNENQNRMSRRHIPKGINFDNMTRTEVKKLEQWLNDYPRRLFHGLSANEVYAKEFYEELQEDTA